MALKVPVVLLVVTATLCVLLAAQVQDSGIRGAHLRVSAFELRPLAIFEKDRNGKVVVSGSLIELVKWMSERLKFTYEIVLPADSPVLGWMNSNGSWTGVMGQVHRKEVDLVACLCAVNDDKKREFADVTASITYEVSSLMIPYPLIKDNFLATLTPFQYQVWIALIFSTVAAIISILLVEKLLRVKLDGDIYLFSVIASQGGFLKSTSLAIRLLCGCWCLSALIITQVYNGTLASHLTMTMKDVPINSLKDLAEKPEYQLVTFKGSGTEYLLLTSVSELHKTVSNNLLPQNRMADIGAGVYKVLSPDRKSVYAMEYFVIEEAIKNTYKRFKKCVLTTGEEKFFAKHYFMLVPKKSPYKSIISLEILRYTDMGFIRMWLDRYKNESPGYHKCMEKKSSETGHAPFTLKQIYSTLLIYAFGVTVSAMVFTTEVVYYRVKRVKKNRH